MMVMKQRKHTSYCSNWHWQNNTFIFFIIRVQIMSTPSKLRKQMRSKILLKKQQKNRNLREKDTWKRGDRVKSLLRLFGYEVGGGLYNFYIGCLISPNPLPALPSQPNMEPIFQQNFVSITPKDITLCVGWLISNQELILN